MGAFNWKWLLQGDRSDIKTSGRGPEWRGRVKAAQFRGRKARRHRHRATVACRSARQATLFIEPAKCSRNVRFSPESGGIAASHLCRYCCKSRKSNDPENLVKADFLTSLPLQSRSPSSERRSRAATSGVNPSSDHNRGAKRFGRRVRLGPLCWHQQRPRTKHIGTNYFQRAHP